MRRIWDWPLFLLILAIGSVSLLVIYSINKNLALNQLVFWLLGLTVLYFVSLFDFRSFLKISLGFYVLTIIFLTLVHFVGEPVRGSIRWIDLGFFRFQPSEIAKVSSVIALASFYSQKSAKDLRNLVLSLLIILPLVFLILIQPDIGNALIIVCIWFGISLISGLQIKHLLIFSLLAIILATFSYEVLAPYQKGRISAFINPEKDPLGAGYNIIQSKIAIGSGQFFGRGLGRGSQSQLKFLPETESDFIFAVTGEQLGFLGASLVIVLFTAILLRIINFAKNDIDRFSQLIMTGITSFMLSQFFINIGMNMGIVPVTGITLPLVSYGGSSLVSTLFLLGIIFSIRRLRSQIE